MATDLDDPNLNRCNLTSNPPQPAPCFSPPGCWDSSFLDLRKASSKFLPQAWVPKTIESTPDLVGEPDRTPTAFELAVLHDYQRLLRALLSADIEKQNYGYDFSTGLWSVLEPFLPGQNHEAFFVKLRPMLVWSQEDAGAAVVQQKLLFNRARPYQVEPSLEPMFEPGHPSYPSGHSTQSHAVAFITADVLMAANDQNRRLAGAVGAVLAEARAIAVNREVAGVHYPSDTLAGIRLARKLVDCYKNQTEFRALYFEPAVAALQGLLDSNS